MARRRLRSTVEKRGISINEEYLAAADTVIKVSCTLSSGLAAQEGRQGTLTAEGCLQALDSVQRDLDGLATGCRLSRQAVLGARESTAGLLTDTERLQSELAANQKHTQLVQQFLEQYQLSASEVEALQARNNRLVSTASVPTKNLQWTHYLCAGPRHW